MRLSDVLKIWEILHIRVGIIKYIDLRNAIENVVGIEKDIQFILQQQKAVNDKIKKCGLTPNLQCLLKPGMRVG